MSLGGTARRSAPAPRRPRAGRARRLADGLLPHVEAAGVLRVDQLGEAAARVAALAAQVAEVQVVVLEPEQRERVVDRGGAQLGVDLVALDLPVVEVLEDSAALVGFLRVALVELEVILHRLLGDPIELLVEGWPSLRLELIPGHRSLLVRFESRVPETGPAETAGPPWRRLLSRALQAGLRGIDRCPAEGGSNESARSAEREARARSDRCG